jgi:hypothetical protein
MRNPGPPFADEIDWTLPLRAPSLSPSPSPGGGGYASYPRINPLAARLGVSLTKSCTRSVLCPQRWQGASLGLEMLESMIPAGLGKEAGAFSLPLISLLSSATPSPHTSHGDLVVLRTRLILALASGGSATREALREATLSFALEGERICSPDYSAYHLALNVFISFAMQVVVTDHCQVILVWGLASSPLPPLHQAATHPSLSSPH